MLSFIAVQWTCVQIFTHIFTLSWETAHTTHLEPNNCSILVLVSEHNKEVILEMFNWPIWCCRVVFATIALGIGTNLKDVNTIYQYGAPKSIWWLFPGEWPRRMQQNHLCSWSFRLSSKEVANKLKRWRGSSCEEVLGEWHCMSSTVTTRPFWPDLYKAWSKPEHLSGCDVFETDTE